MHCPHCGQRLFYKDLAKRTWCSHCATVVSVSYCSVPYWIVGTVCAMCLVVQLWA